MCCDAATGVPPSLQDIPGRSCESAALLDARTGSAGFCPGRGTRVCVKHGTWGLSDAVLHAQVRSTRRARNRRSGSVGGRQWRGSVSTLRGGRRGRWVVCACVFVHRGSFLCLCGIWSIAVAEEGTKVTLPYVVPPSPRCNGRYIPTLVGTVQYLGSTRGNQVTCYPSPQPSSTFEAGALARRLFRKVESNFTARPRPALHSCIFMAQARGDDGRACLTDHPALHTFSPSHWSTLRYLDGQLRGSSAWSPSCTPAPASPNVATVANKRASLVKNPRRHPPAMWSTWTTPKATARPSSGQRLVIATYTSVC